MKDVLKRIAPSLRTLGFQGSGQNYRKRDKDFVFIINFQGSRGGDSFFVNLGAQPIFIPAEGNADVKSLKEYECVFRKRVGEDWPWEISEEIFSQLEREVVLVQAEFFGNAQTLPEVLATGAPHDLLKKFGSEVASSRTVLHLARAAVKLGHIETAQKLVSLGKELANEQAVIFKSELEKVLGEHPKH
ncbi:DUF4304 domain-containing protein [Comamonas guangdongensis]|uniref:DUF4304 domain-containing protein n=1 Tax=Comamonas guangdongensis TaxID=510515 RepID=A0ABV3ZYU0_9BURK